MLDILGKIGDEYQKREDRRLYTGYGGGASGGLPFLFGNRPGEGPQRNQLADMLTGKYQERKRDERMAGEAIKKYFGIG